MKLTPKLKVALGLGIFLVGSVAAASHLWAPYNAFYWLSYPLCMGGMFLFGKSLKQLLP